MASFVTENQKKNLSDDFPADFGNIYAGMKGVFAPIHVWNINPFSNTEVNIKVKVMGPHRQKHSNVLEMLWPPYIGVRVE